MLIHVWDLYHDLVHSGLRRAWSICLLSAQMNDDDRGSTEDQLTAMISDAEPLFETERLAEPGSGGCDLFVSQFGNNDAGGHGAICDHENLSFWITEYGHDSD